MKYKILLTGKNGTVINDFFQHINDDIEVITTSLRYDDIMRHLKYFEPDVFCWCITDEAVDNISTVVSIKTRLDKDKIIFAAIGSEDGIKEFESVATFKADMVMSKQLKAEIIEEKLIEMLIKRDAELELNQDAAKPAYDNIEEEMFGGEEGHFAEEAVQAEEAAGRHAAPAKGSERKHVLVIDDSSAMLKAIREQLKYDYNVGTALSGSVALKFLEKKTTDLILLDYEMPGESGPEVLEKLRANPATADIPVIFLTGIQDRAKIAKVLAMKPQGYLLKPIDHDKLMEAIEKTLGGNS